MFRHLWTALAFSAVAIIPLTVIAADAKEAPSAFTEKQRAELETRMRDFILANPQVLIDSVEEHYNEQGVDKTAQEGRLDEVPAGLLDNDDAPFIGPKDAKVAVVEFFDYNCGYCKQVAADLMRFAKDVPQARIVFKELPILSDSSEVAARYALAANMQDRYVDFHNALMSHQGPINEAFLESTAKDLKLDVAKLKADANTQDIRDKLKKNVEMARSLGVRGTPFFIIGKEKAPGAIGYTTMIETYNRENAIATGAVPAVGAAAPAAAAAPTAPRAPSASKAAATPEIEEAKREIDAELKKTQEDTMALINELKVEAEKMKKAAEEAEKNKAE